MATTAANLILDVRSRIVEVTASYFTDAEILRWLNQAYKRFISQTEWAEKCKAYVITANVFEYALPTDVVKVYDMRWMDKYKVWFRDQEEWGRLIGSQGETPGPRPYMYRLFPWDGWIRINPYPTAASATSTITDCTASSSTTTINVVSTADFPSYGRIIVDSEQILYHSKTSTSFTNCQRGDGATTAASHSFNATIYHAPLEVYMQYQPADLTTSPSTSTIIGPSYDEALINYACHVAMLKRERYDESQLFRKLYDDQVAIAIAERRKVQMDRQFVIKDEDDYGSYYAWI